MVATNGSKKNVRGSGSIVQHSADSLTLIIDDRSGPATGKRRRRWITLKRFPGEKDEQLWRRAEREQRRFRVQKDTGGNDLVPQRLTVGEFRNRWLDDYARLSSVTER